MTTPRPIAIIDGRIYGHREIERVEIRRSKARCAGADGVTFYAPGWRALVFRSVEAAKAKMERHPGFQSWVA